MAVKLEERPSVINNRNKNSSIRFNNYFDEIYRTSHKYLAQILNSKEIDMLIKTLSKAKCNSEKECIRVFDKIYCQIIKKKHQAEHKRVDPALKNFLYSKESNVKLIWGDALTTLRKMDSESVHLMVTSPPYYNAREYSQWDNIEDYFLDMKEIIQETYRVLDNHRVWVFNVGDIFDNPRTKSKSVWGKTRLPLGAYFTKLFEECGFTFVDDIIWDKGEVQSERHKHASNPYPLYIYPMNCYEHLLIFHKHRLDTTKYPCPVCGTLNVNGNTQSEPGLQSWECKNDDCFQRSASNRGKRFSIKTNLVQSEHNQKANKEIDLELRKKWRRDVVRFSPVIKINCKGENLLGHTAPFPRDIPEMAINFFTYPRDIVLDPFGGSFTTALCAAELDRVGVGLELNKSVYRKVVLKLLKNPQKEFDFSKKQIKAGEFDLTNERKVNRQL